MHRELGRVLQNLLFCRALFIAGVKIRMPLRHLVDENVVGSADFLFLLADVAAEEYVRITTPCSDLVFACGDVI